MSATRELPSGLAAALSAKEVGAVFLVEIDWPAATLYLWNGYHDLSWNGHTWLGLGHLGGISEIKESTGGEANGLTLTLSGVPSANVAEALRNDTQGRAARVFFGVINGAGFSIDPYCIFDGLMDVPTITEDGTKSTISISIEKELVDNRTAARRLTHEDQQIAHPGDRGFEFVAGLSSKTFTWGKATSYPSTPPSGGGGDGSDATLSPQLFPA